MERGGRLVGSAFFITICDNRLFYCQLSREGGEREKETENEREIRNAFANAPHTILRQKFCANESAFLGVGPTLSGE